MKSMLQESPKDEEGILRSVEKVHEMIDNEIETGISPKSIFVCGFSQGGKYLDYNLWFGVMLSESSEIHDVVNY